ncbi:MAG: bifunctional diaminohydroxyphosphoribosylaminopyrimidine deaminase/5-amino-6-(5-phosphoribosylamino)uracil reductase RibD [Flavobacteriaceae bacterium]|nr:bifunctional diaminohydroxyphosphoribosylaminopyrimidine deaminase/5-amino-6-(5-phosphoribosylamino)uracil reductase RibD [Flavobacteriaceae bacterium]
MSKHQKYIQRCIDLAQNGLGKTYPNPMVGSVVVYKDSIIGEGWHQKAGEPHAEVNAIAGVKDKSLLKKATIYVSLEPCSHFGKTPPCADLIIAHKIPKVVVGCLDPNPKVAGRGVKKLLESGCEVAVGILENECKNLNKRFFTFHQKKRPYIILKWAQTADGFIAPKEQETGKPFWITGSASKQLLHKWRSEEQAILVGTTTVLKDNPQLTNRIWEGNNPVRVVLDQHLKINKEAAVLDGTMKTIVITSNNQTDFPVYKNVHFETVVFDKNLSQHICEVLYNHQIQSVIIEGGTQTLMTFIESNLWDQARVFTSQKILNQGIKAPVLNKNINQTVQISEDQLSLFYND